MKKMMVWFLLLCLLSGFQTVFAAKTCGTNVKYTISGDTITFARSDPDKTAVWKENCKDVFADNANITVVKIRDKIKVKDASDMFRFAYYVKEMDLRNLDLSGVTDMSSMFADCDNLKTLNASGWDTSKVKTMRRMFFYCSSLKKLNISGWKTSNVEDMDGMFWGCSSLTKLDLSGWKVSNVEDMHSMFRDCSFLTKLDLNGWKTSNVEDMSFMFMNCSSLTGLNLSSWNTAGLRLQIDVFKGCTSLKVLVLGRNTLQKNIFKSLPKYKKTWYYVVQGAAAGSPLPLKTAKTNSTLFTKYKYKTMAGAWSTTKTPGLASSIIIRNSKGTKITGKTVICPTRKYRLSAGAKPAGAAQTVTWKSGNTDIATVTKEGLVVFKKAGVVRITATSTDLAKKTAYVRLKLLPKATSIIIRDPNGNVVTGKTVTTNGLTYQLSASALPAKAAQTVTWESSNPNVATVTKKGLVTFKVTGMVTITATSTDRGKKYSNVNVFYNPGYFE